jgi:hypothetical protein
LIEHSFLRHKLKLMSIGNLGITGTGKNACH